jgi:hypothetical protein
MKSRKIFLAGLIFFGVFFLEVPVADNFHAIKPSADIFHNSFSVKHFTANDIVSDLQKITKLIVAM